VSKQLTTTTQCGFVTIVGRPNVGKSTLFNHIVGQALSITTNKPQTTRHQILGVKTFDNTQMVFIDTPGLTQDPSYALQHYMNQTLRDALSDVNVILFVVEALNWKDGDTAALNMLEHTDTPVILAINKVDEVQDKRQLLPFIDQLNQKRHFEQIVPLSAMDGTNVDVLEQAISWLLAHDEFFFPEDVTSASSDEFLAAEVVREKLMRVLGQEVPYALTVETEQMRIHDNGVLVIDALIWVEKPGQKKIVIGRKGAMLKKIGEKARLSMEKLFGQRVYLQLWVKVKRGWSNDEKALQRFGYNKS